MLKLKKKKGKKTFFIDFYLKKNSNETKNKREQSINEVILNNSIWISTLFFNS